MEYLLSNDHVPLLIYHITKYLITNLSKAKGTQTKLNCVTRVKCLTSLLGTL